MINQRLFNFLILFFIGIFVIYFLNNPPVVIAKYPNIDKLTNVSYFDMNPDDKQFLNDVYFIN